MNLLKVTWGDIAFMDGHALKNLKNNRSDDMFRSAPSLLAESTDESTTTDLDL